ncbi:hypothetical protein AB0E62_35900 [Streptomyces sp. NPDC038707]|uniref:hypothetical protein n=1 Tax=Streptomyces sp. NPDC038707 TaxID=3154329 RepID=UPI003401F150
MPEPTQPLDLDAIEARAAAATPGPWCTDGAEIYQGSEYLPGLSAWIGETCRADEGDGGKADARFIAAMSPETVKAMADEIRRLRADASEQQAEIAKLIRWHGEDETAMKKMRGAIERLRAEKRTLGELAARRESELIALRARVAGMERPAVEKQRGEVVQSFRELAAQCREDRDYEGEATVLQRLEDRQQQWAREDAAAQSAAVVAHVVADDSDNPDTLPAWLSQRFDPRGPDWEQLSDDDRAYWEHHARAVRRAVTRGGFKDPAAVPTAARPTTGQRKDDGCCR